MGVSALGWNSISAPGATRVGPHLASASNPRHIGFRNSATGDLLAAAMWLIHTGNGGNFPDYPVREWHGLRPLNAGFGTSNSDHHGGVAMDVHWSSHPWEQRIGTASYNNHIYSSYWHVRHSMFAAIEKRLTVPGHDPILRWCGRSWLRRDGWGYPVGYRDCMHWVIESPNWTRINAAAARLRTWFIVPRTVNDIKTHQKRCGAVQDGVWGPGSIKAQRSLQGRLGVPKTGLPGDVATINAYKKATSGSGFTSSHLRWVQTSLNTLRKNGKVSFSPALKVTGMLDVPTKSAVKAFQTKYKLERDGFPGYYTTVALKKVLD